MLIAERYTGEEMGKKFRIIGDRVISSNASINNIGGKAYGLMKLNEFGFNVPETVVIPVNQEYNKETYKEVMKFADKILKENGETLFSVRSSGCMEDSEQTSFAGMYETFLNVSKDEIDVAIKKCYSSASSERIDDYSELMNVSNENVNKMAIVIQPMINADQSGVLFTCNPITGQKDELIIETIDGIGEKLVSGNVTPYYYCFNKKNGKLVDFEKGDENQGGIEKVVTSQLCEDAVELEKCFNSNMDIEFSVMNGEVVYLQARNITSMN